ncbi:alpha/beta hydrolase [Virgisporangium aurantiacum]|uniref:Alpha/beta hydrolase n=1 Tax=Virgisporangium aurantiacum TaxID=175570 RepID=A0A8J3ZLT9_9ACTN|nr:alpha/beta hydrolase [Virgisporangium aurantiacum]GIJ63893.1 alpha/beta hydrolase [Virgisporangium aurantiacum]
MPKIMRLAAFALLATVSVAVVTPSAAQAETDPPGASCATYTVPVKLSATDTTTYNLVGRLCVVATDIQRGARTVELLVPGITYDRLYFNSTYQPSTYSYVFAATGRGYSTFAIDRLGTGMSDHPAPNLLTTQSHAYVVGQLVQKLRAGAIGTRAFSTVVGVGHSYGAGILQYLAGTATDTTTVPNYLVLNSFLTATYSPSVSLFANSLWSTKEDPIWSKANLPDGYITTIPGTRDDLFFHLSGSNSTLVSQDESSKSTATTAERASVGAARNPAVLAAVKVPVLIVAGQYDALYCNEASGLSCANSAAVFTREKPNWGIRACMSAYAVANAGHSFAFHTTAADAYTYTNNWVDSYTFTGTKNSDGCVV